MAGGIGGRFGPVCRKGFGEDIGDVIADRVDTDEQRFGNLAIGLAGRNQP